MWATEQISVIRVQFRGSTQITWFESNYKLNPTTSNTNQSASSCLIGWNLVHLVALEVSYKLSGRSNKDSLTHFWYRLATDTASPPYGLIRTSVYQPIGIEYLLSAGTQASWLFDLIILYSAACGHAIMWTFSALRLQDDRQVSLPFITVDASMAGYFEDSKQKAREK